ncbi:MAG: (2Fe-2S)-binding protein [Thaumarchaeota archaeon]|nr:(2Fe-2S)-binding protein [Nitrososphaerota archaeon]
MQEVKITVNGVKRLVPVKSNWTLLRLLRQGFGCNSVKEVCGIGECGTCTVIKDGKPVSSCIELAIRTNGSIIITAEGLAVGDRLHPVQQSFVEEGGFQCGFCTPGMIVMAKTLLDENPTPTLDEIKEYMAGNLCRCTGYWQIVSAIQKASERIAKTTASQPQRRNNRRL